MVDIMNIANCKKAYRKLSEGYICKPPVGTCIMPPKGQVRRSNGFHQDIYTSKQVAELTISNPGQFNALKQAGCIVMPGQLVLCSPDEEWID